MATIILAREVIKGGKRTKLISLLVERKVRISLNMVMRLKMSFLAMALLCIGAEADDAVKI